MATSLPQRRSPCARSGEAGDSAASGVVPMSMEQKVAALREPSTYARRPARIEVVETHMAWVFLTDRRAFKMKKPVKTPVLDFSSLAARRRDCEREVALNRPLAPSVYVGVVALSAGEGGGFRLGSAGAAAEWLVSMRRLADGDSLAARIASRTAGRREVERAIEWLVRFYTNQSAEPFTGASYRARLASQVREAKRELLRPRYQMPADRVRRLTDARLYELDRFAALFDRRAEEGAIIDAHGDLRPEHIFLRPEPVIIDCLEFNRDLRLLDPASELAFLALECERLGAPWIGRVALATYSAQTGDEPPARLRSFYRATHALSRAVLALWHLDDPGRLDGSRFRQKALTYLDLAEMD